jgi:hypothetical protein
MLSAQAQHLAQSRQNQRRRFLPGQRRRCDAEEAKPRSDDGLFLELVVPNSVIAGDDDPAVQAGFSAPDDIFRALRKELVVDADLDTGGSERLGHFLSAQRSVDKEYEGLRRLSPAGARSGPLPRC